MGELVVKDQGPYAKAWQAASFHGATIRTHVPVNCEHT